MFANDPNEQFFILALMAFFCSTYRLYQDSIWFFGYKIALISILASNPAG